MGQEASHEQIDESIPPQKLTDRTIDAVANLIKDGKVSSIVVMTGAGISTSAGIPDFRSPDTGLYANLARLNLPYAEAVFDISYFRQNPRPFYTLAKELYPGKFKPTPGHAFIALLEKKGLLRMLFTQNIDCLERAAGVPDSRIVEAHGSFATQRCIDCQTEYAEDLMKKTVEAGDVPHCEVPNCNGIVKPDIVFFGEQLPENFNRNKHIPQEADLAIVMGTSLTVYPFAGLPQIVRDGVPRVLLNLEAVGGLGSRPDDVLVLGEIDTGVRRMADALGWRQELEDLWRSVGGKMTEGEAENVQEAVMSKDERMEAEIEKLTAEVDATLKMSESHQTRANEGLMTNGKETSSPKKVEENFVTFSEDTHASEVHNHDAEKVDDLRDNNSVEKAQDSDERAPPPSEISTSSLEKPSSHI